MMQITRVIREEAKYIFCNLTQSLLILRNFILFQELQIYDHTYFDSFDHNIIFI